MGSEVCVGGSCLVFFLLRTRGNYTDKSDSNKCSLLRRGLTSFRLFGGSGQLGTVVLFQRGLHSRWRTFHRKGVWLLFKNPTLPYSPYPFTGPALRSDGKLSSVTNQPRLPHHIWDFASEPGEQHSDLLWVCHTEIFSPRWSFFFFFF